MSGNIMYMWFPLSNMNWTFNIQHDKVIDLTMSGCFISFMVGIAQLVERRIVIPDVAGSSPVSHPNY